MRKILVEIEVDDEGYEDVCDELLLEDMFDLVGWSVKYKLVKGDEE